MTEIGEGIKDRIAGIKLEGRKNGSVINPTFLPERHSGVLKDSVLERRRQTLSPMGRKNLPPLQTRYGTSTAYWTIRNSIWWFLQEENDTSPVQKSRSWLRNNSPFVHNPYWAEDWRIEEKSREIKRTRFRSIIGGVASYLLSHVSPPVGLYAAGYALGRAYTAAQLHPNRFWGRTYMYLSAAGVVGLGALAWTLDPVFDGPAFTAGVVWGGTAAHAKINKDRKRAIKDGEKEMQEFSGHIED